MLNGIRSVNCYFSAPLWLIIGNIFVPRQYSQQSSNICAFVCMFTLESVVALLWEVLWRLCVANIRALLNSFGTCRGLWLEGRGERRRKSLQPLRTRDKGHGTQLSRHEHVFPHIVLTFLFEVPFTWTGCQIWHPVYVIFLCHASKCTRQYRVLLSRVKVPVQLIITLSRPLPANPWDRVLPECEVLVPPEAGAARI
jgi:hypothetical protein